MGGVCYSTSMDGFIAAFGVNKGLEFLHDIRGSRAGLLHLFKQSPTVSLFLFTHTVTYMNVNSVWQWANFDRIAYQTPESLRFA